MHTRNPPAIRQALMAALRTLIELVPRLEGDDADAIHRARVATRRARALLWLASPAFPTPLDEKPIRRLTQALGAIRDEDVLLDLARNYGLEGELGSGVDRAAAGESLRRELESGDALEALALAAAESSLDSRAQHSLHRRFGRACRRVLRCASERGRKMSDRELHELRIRLKRLRYASAGLEIDPAVVSGFQEALGRIQDRLGAHHDLTVLASRIGDDGRLGEEIEKARRRAIRSLASLDGPAVAGLIRELRTFRRKRLHKD